MLPFCVISYHSTISSKHLSLNNSEKRWGGGGGGGRHWESDRARNWPEVETLSGETGIPHHATFFLLVCSPAGEH